MTSPVLEYKSPTEKRWRRWTWFHAWALPLAIAPGAMGSMYWYGDEYGALAGSHYPAVLLIQLLPETMRAPFLRGQFLLIVMMTLLLLACVGLVMDRLRLSRWIYVLIPAVFLALVLTRTFAPARRPGRQWEPDALCVAWCWSVYVLLLLLIPAVVIWRLWRRRQV